jgi:hypothetical protein
MEQDCTRCGDSYSPDFEGTVSGMCAGCEQEVTPLTDDPNTFVRDLKQRGATPEVISRLFLDRYVG